MNRKSVALGATVVLWASTAFAENGTIRVNVQKGWGHDGEYISAKCWAADGHASTHWERIHENSHKTCHGANYMRVDFHVHHAHGMPTTWRFFRGTRVENADSHLQGTYYDCSDDQVLKITVRNLLNSNVVNTVTWCQ